MFVRPCVLSNEMSGSAGVSRSRGRRERMRRTAVRKSVLASRVLKEFLQNSPQPKESETSLNADAKPYMPMDIDWYSLNFELTPEDLLEVAPASRRRQLKVTCVAELLPEPPAVDPGACRVFNTASGDNLGRRLIREPCCAGTVIPRRRDIREVCSAGSLPAVTPSFGLRNVTVTKVEDLSASTPRGESIDSAVAICSGFDGNILNKTIK